MNSFEEAIKLIMADLACDTFILRWCDTLVSETDVKMDTNSTLDITAVYLSGPDGNW